MRIDQDFLEDNCFESEADEIYRWFVETFPNGSTLKTLLKEAIHQDFFYEEWFFLFKVLNESGPDLDLEHIGNITKRSDYLAPGTLTVDGNLKVNGNLIIGNDLVVSGDLFVNGSLTCSGCISVNGNIDVRGSIYCGTYIDCGDYLQGSLDIESGLNEEKLNESIYDPAGYISVKKYISTAESIVVNRGDLIADHSISCGNDLKVKMGYIQTNGDIDVDGDIVCENSSISAGGSIYGSDIWASGYIVADKNIRANSITVDDDFIEAINVVAIDEIKTGPIKCYNLVADSVEADGEIVIANDIIVVKNIISTLSIVVGERIYAGGSINTGDEFNIIAGYRIKNSDWKKDACVKSATCPPNILSGGWKKISVKQVNKVRDAFFDRLEKLAEDPNSLLETEEKANELTYIDQQTGLMWAKDCNLAGEKKTWHHSRGWLSNLSYGGFSDWRLPTISEIEKFILDGKSFPDWFNNNGFFNLKIESYWSSSEFDFNREYAYVVDMDMTNEYNGNSFGRSDHTYNGNKYSSYYIWPVRTL